MQPNKRLDSHTKVILEYLKKHCYNINNKNITDFVISLTSYPR